MPGKQSDDGSMDVAAVEDGGDEGLGGLTVEELQQGQETALALEDMMALSAQTLVRTEVDELYEEVRPLGQGRFGRVLLVTHRQKGTGCWAQACHTVQLRAEIAGKLAKS
ncbi:serine/threonine-protein kinase SBK2-like protein [Cricetulus griseus]|uniref:Serine/threonine-protein kinase SBK2-like protein n=1 Tax=Cricetulus griseus TaxID=10029 RepID=A0A061HWL9_CRIGR|nr:serine/threonine-protein kinase SBK2-like protein [Cricetulus griseus]